MIQGLLVILCLQLMGEFISSELNIPIPGSVIGMIALLVILTLKSNIQKNIEQAADCLVKYIGLLFVPAGAGISLYLNLIVEQWVIIIIASFSSTILTLLVSAFMFEFLSKDKDI